MTDEIESRVRIDKWLWFVRFYKTRSQASAAVNGGHVKLNGERAKPGHRVGAGDVIEVVRRQLPYAVTISSVPTRRGPAKEAAACYSESAASLARREKTIDRLKSDRLQMPVTRGRPDKRTRRALRGRNRGADR